LLHSTIRSTVLCLILASVPIAAFGDDLEIDDAWIRLPPPKTNAAAYLTIENRLATAMVIVAATSGGAERVEIHRTVEEDGVTRMIPVPSLTIAPGETVAFEPGGLHLMLIRPRALTVGEKVEIALTTDGGEPIRFDAEVRKRAAKSDGHDHHEGHH